MKNQRYGMIFQTTLGSNYFYDSGTGKVIGCDSKEIKLIDRILKNEISLEKACEENKEFKEFIEKENLFRCPERIPFYIPTIEELEASIKGQCTQIIIELTEECNLRCGYCIYNKHHPKYRDFGNRSMPFEIAKKTLDIVLKDYKRDKFFLTFYGGEPLANFDLMKKCIEYVRNNYKEINLGVSFTTNLTLLTIDMINYFNTLYSDGISINIMCSIDGPKDIHDRFRRFKNGKGSFEKVIENFNLLMDNFYEKNNGNKNISINCVITPPCSEEKISLIKNFFEKELNLPDDVKFNLGYIDEGDMVFDYNENKEVNEEEMVSFESVSISNWVTNNVIKSNEHFIKRSDINLLLPTIQAISHRRVSNGDIFKEKFLHGNCIPGQRRLYVTVDGEFKPCERVGKCPSIGNYKDGINIENILKYYFKEYIEYYEDKCSKCWAQELCSICYSRNMGENGIDEEEGLCEETRREIKMKFENYYNLLENKKSELKEVVDEIIV